MVAALILLCGLLAYHNVPGNSFHDDDEHSILENPHLRSLGNAARFFVDAGTFSGMPEARLYRPLLVLSYALNYSADGYEPLGYHLVNIALHLSAALLLWRLGLALGLLPRAALVAGLFFVVHPVLGEPVNYISSRSSLMATALVLTAFLLALRCRAVVQVQRHSFCAAVGAVDLVGHRAQALAPDVCTRRLECVLCIGLLAPSSARRCWSQQVLSLSKQGLRRIFKSRKFDVLTREPILREIG